MLEDFITTHRQELVKRCSEKAAARNGSPTADADLYQHGIPEFLYQLVDTLRKERLPGSNGINRSDSLPLSPAMGRSAALHGADLLLQGYDIEQVVREYGDVCQAITALAVELDKDIAAEEFRILNRCLDDAIAVAVNAFAHSEQSGIRRYDGAASERLYALFDEHRRLIDIAIRAQAAIASGHVGMTGATGNLLVHTLHQMKAHAKSTQDEIERAPEIAVFGSPDVTTVSS